jgi:cytochrome oxidase Cu insertion factor (SCO1/SenC/PrrC family)
MQSMWTAGLLVTIVSSATVYAGPGEALAEPGEALAEDGAHERVRVMNTLDRFRLRSQDGEPFGSQDLEGKVWIATFIFTRCAATCPAQTAAFKRLQTELSQHPSGKDVHLISITVDPQNDKAAVLREYANEVGADTSSWTFLTGKRPDIVELCEKGFKLPLAKAEGDAPIVHSQNFVLVDRARRIRGHYDGLNEDALDQLRKDLEGVLIDPPGPATMTRRDYFDYKNPGPVVHVPSEIEDVPWMGERAEAQAATLDRFKVYNDFSFTDRLPDSGITFVNRVVDDATKDYKAVHYDHGNGMAVADVDGDGLHDVYFVTQLGANHLYKNVGGGKFQDMTEAAGVGLGERVSVSASFADVDNDGDADLYVTTVRFGNVLFENDGKGHFTDITEASGLGHVGHCSSAVFFDYDRDGLLDVLVTIVGIYTTDEVGRGGYYVGHPDAFTGQLKPERFKRSLLFHNEGDKKFVDVTKQTGLIDKSWTGSASPIDLNEDGWQDLYLLNMQGHDEYWENVGGKSFVNKGREVFPKTPWGSMGIKVFDFDNDGRMDIYVTDMHTDMIDDTLRARRNWFAEKMKMTDMFPKPVLNTDGKHILGNAFFHNRGGGNFREVSEEVGAENYWPWGLSVGDLNADGWEDAVVISSMNYPFRYAINSVLLNNAGEEFLDSEFILGVEPRRDGRSSAYWFSLDCSGADKDHPACGKKRKGEIDIWAALGSRSSAVFDIDLDGDLDILTNDFNSEPMVLMSDLSERKPDLRYLLVDLVGSKSNRNGLGARVQVKVGERTLTKVQDGQSGYMSQSVYPLYFGLADAKTVDEISVTWPSGGVQVLTGPIEAGQVVTVGEE